MIPESPSITVRKFSHGFSGSLLDPPTTSHEKKNIENLKGKKEEIPHTANKLHHSSRAFSIQVLVLLGIVSQQQNRNSEKYQESWLSDVDVSTAIPAIKSSFKI
jgi:hypothetical protein